MGQWYYEDGTPVPEAMLPPELRAQAAQPVPDGMRDEAMQRHAAQAMPPPEPPAEPQPQLPEVGRAHALGLGFVSGLPGGNRLHEEMRARELSTSPEEMRARAAAGPLGIDRAELLARAGVPPEAANRPGSLRIPAGAMNQPPQYRPATGPVEPDEGARMAAQQQLEAEREGAWQQHPVLYGGGKVGGFVATDAALGGLAPALSFAKGVPRAGGLARKLLPAARAGGAQGAIYGAGDSESIADVPVNAALGGATGAVLGPAGEVVGAGVGAARRALGRSAEASAVRSLNAAGPAGRMAAQRGQEGMREVGRTILDLPEAQLRKGPRGVFEPGSHTSPLAKAMGPVAQELNGIASMADQAGGAFNLADVLARFDQAMAGVAKDPLAAKRVAAVRDYIVQSAQSRGTWNGQTRQLLALAPSEAHAMRQGLDDAIYDALTGLPKRSPVARQFHQVRRLVDDELGDTIMRTLGPDARHAWERANRQYHNLADVQRLARAGYQTQAAQEYAPTMTRMRIRGPFGIPTPFTQGAASPNYRLMAAHARGADVVGTPFAF